MKKLLKKYYKVLIFYIVLFIVLVFPLPYYIEAPGRLIDINDRVKINNESRTTGSFNLAYVSVMKANVSTSLFSLLKKEWKLIKKEEIVSSNETVKETEYRDHFLLKEANDNALIVAYQKASKYYKIEKQQLYVTYIFNEANTDLKIEDQIISINNIEINERSQIDEIIENSNVGDNLDIEVINNNKEYNRTAKIIEYQSEKLIGIMINYKREITSEPNITFNFKNSESGASGGLMMALTIYDKLIDEDLTKGYKIAGTGTIDVSGNVGIIDGIKYKIMGANKEKADLFLVPEDNYEEALKVKKKYNYKLKIVKIKTFDEAVEYLKTLK